MEFNKQTDWTYTFQPIKFINLDDLYLQQERNQKVRWEDCAWQPKGVQ